MKEGELKLNKKLLRSIMILHDDNNDLLAAALGITPQRLSAKMNETGGAEFTQGEIKIIVKRYNLTPQQVIDIFFSDDVS